ncbi:MAG: histidine--tRNA ligase [Kistimonas sp.]|nr:histidine--tRNA ligase [Kistimonas sp.]
MSVLPPRAVRGMSDILPDKTRLWSWLEGQLRQLMSRYSYAEIRTPLLESTRLFARGIGAGTDVVEKEMYSFSDRSGDSLTLRPEATAGCVRAGMEHGLFHNRQERLWSYGPMFRYERPQKGRYRQFHQLSVEAFGMEGPDIDAEQILMTRSLWQQLGLTPYVQLELNSLGTAQARAAYRDTLKTWLEQRQDALDEDSRRRIHTNPMRVLDSKDPATRALLTDAPQLPAFLDGPSREHFEQLCASLDEAGVSYTLNPALVRGLDYYSRTVFEWTTTELGAQGAVCSGGRYDGLTTQLGGKPVTACGFALGMERLVLLLESCQRLPELAAEVDAALVSCGDLGSYSLLLADKLRAACPGLRLQLICGGGSIKSRMKRADRSGARLALLVGESEKEQGTVTVKFLREERDQLQLSFDDLVSSDLLASEPLADPGSPGAVKTGKYSGSH